MTTLLRSKTLTASLNQDSRSVFEWIADPSHLARWYSPLGRFAPIRFIRDDRALVLDLVVTLSGIEMTLAIRVFANGHGSEVVLTLIQPQGLSDTAFHEQSRWAGSAIAELKKIKPEIQIPAADMPSIETPHLSLNSSAETEAPQISTVPVSGRKLFVGNLPFAWTEDQLRELFAVHGTITHVGIPRLRGRHGRSRGFGFVEMSTETEALLAVEKLHECLAGERKIMVRLARAQESKMEASPSATLAEHTPAPSPLADAAAPEPGNTRQASPSNARPRRNIPARNKRPAPTRSAASNRPPRRPADRPDRPRRDTGISNSSGYEIYPRDSKGGFATEPTSRSAETPQTPVDASPYFDDTGDFEIEAIAFLETSAANA